MNEDILNIAKGIARSEMPDLDAAKARVSQRKKAKLSTGPQTPDEDLTYLIETIRVNLQHDVNRDMKLKGWDQNDLATHAKVDPDEVDKFFEDDCDVSAMTLIAICGAVGLGLRAKTFWWDD